MESSELKSLAIQLLCEVKAAKQVDLKYKTMLVFQLAS